MLTSSSPTRGKTKLREADASSSQPTGTLAGTSPAQGKKKSGPIAALSAEDHLDEGGHGSGPRGGTGKRAPAIKKQPWDHSVKDTPEYDARKAQKAVDSINAKLDQLKAEYKAKFGVDYVPSVKKESSTFTTKFETRLREKNAPSKGASRYRVTLIEEGLGNFGDAFYYTRDALESAVSAFDGKKSYANHPSKFDEENQPERDTRDILGNFENLEVVDDNGRATLQADLVIPAGEPFDWARAMCEHALNYKKTNGNKEFVGLSINASGDAAEESIDDVIARAPAPCLDKLKEAKEKGIESVNVVSEIQDAVSVDLVTEAGAGGKILKLLEERKNMPGVKKVVKKVAPKKNREAEAGGDDGEDAGHDDAGDDKALIAQMIKKHLGDKSEEMGESEQAEVHENFEAYQAEGMEEEEAMKCALKHHQIEKKKKEKKETAAHEEGADQPPPGKTAESEGAGDDVPPPPKKKESETIKLAGRVAFLESELKKEKLEKHVSRKLSECGLPRKATKLFTEKAGSFRDEKDFDAKFALFNEAYGAERDESLTFVPLTEKSSTGDDNNDLQSFADCVKD